MKIMRLMVFSQKKWLFKLKEESKLIKNYLEILFKKIIEK